MKNVHVNETKKELEDLLESSQNILICKRLFMLLMLKIDPDIYISEIAHDINMHQNTVSRWLRLYDRGGLDALLNINKPGAPRGPRAIPPQALRALKMKLNNGGFSSYKAIHTWLVNEWGLDKLGYGTVWHIVRNQLGGEIKRTKSVSIAFCE